MKKRTQTTAQKAPVANGGSWSGDACLMQAAHQVQKKTRYTPAEVKDLLDEQRQRLEHKPTIFDQFEEAKRNLECVRGDIFQYEEAIKHARDKEAELQSQLRTLGKSIDEFVASVRRS